MSSLRRVAALVAPDWRRFVLSVALGSLTMCTGVGLLAASGYLIARAAGAHTLVALGTTMLAVRLLAVVRPASRYAERLQSHDLAFRNLGAVRARVYRRLEPLAPTGLEAFRDGELLSRMVQDIDELQNLTLRVLVPPAVATVSGVVVVMGVALAVPAAGAVLAVGLLIGATVVPLVANRLATRARAHQAAARAELTSDLVELLEAAPELVVAGADQDRIERVKDRDTDLVRLATRDAAGAAAADALRLLTSGLTLVAVLMVAVAAAGHGSVDPVVVIPVVLVALGAFEIVAPLPAAAQYLASTISSGTRVLDLLERPLPVHDPSQPADPPGPHPDIELDGVTARYAPHADLVLRGGSLSLPSGSRLALVGPSGAGKTTLAQILVRFLEREQGIATLEGRDLRDYRQTDVRDTVTLSGQGAHVFSSTIRENLTIARPDATDAQLQSALERARLWSWVAAQPSGLDTRVGELGRSLSGGQRQRLALARALLADAPVLVLDEPTAHLDRETADALLADLLEETGGRSLLLITHHPDEAAAVDRVVGVEGGFLREAASPLPDE